MFDIGAVKHALSIENEKNDIEVPPRAIPAIRAIPDDSEAENSTNSTNSTPPPPQNKNAAHRLGLLASVKNYDLADLLDWYKSDLQDLSDKSDVDLCFVVSDYVENRDKYRSFKPHTVQCIDCKHFTRIDHSHLGHCGAGVPESPAGMWDTGLRGCDKYIETADAEEHEK